MEASLTLTLVVLGVAAAATGWSLVLARRARHQALELRRLEKLVSRCEQLQADLKAELELKQNQLRTAKTNLAKAERLAAEAGRWEAIGRLVGGAAHGLNNSLQIVRGWALLLQQGDLDEQSKHDAHQDIVQACESAAALTHHLSAVAASEDGGQHVLDLSELLTSSARSLKKLLAERFSIEERTTQGLLIRGNASQLHRALFELGMRAKQTMPKGGVISLSLSPHRSTELRRADANIPASEHGFALLTVEFRGNGNQLQPSAGQANTADIVKQHGGGLFTTSGEQRSAFELYLPLCESAPPESDSSPGPSRELQLLVVEDDARIRQIMNRTLVGAGHRVLVAENGDEALKVAGEFEGVLDLVCCDAIMPGMETGELIETLKRQRPGQRFLICSGHVSDALVQQGINLGHLPFLKKPFALAELVRVVEKTANADRRF